MYCQACAVDGLQLSVNPQVAAKFGEHSCSCGDPTYMHQACFRFMHACMHRSRAQQ
jgi:hypothetical protein